MLKRLFKMNYKQHINELKEKNRLLEHDIVTLNKIKPILAEACFYAISIKSFANIYRDRIDSSESDTRRLIEIANNMIESNNKKIIGLEEQLAKSEFVKAMHKFSGVINKLCRKLGDLR